MNDTRMPRRLRLPVLFEENRGQKDASIHFSASAQNEAFYIHSTKITTVLFSVEEQQALREKQPNLHSIGGVSLALSFVGARDGIIPQGVDAIEAKRHRLIGNNPAEWRTNIPLFQRLRYSGLWEGVDLELAEGEAGLKLYWLMELPEYLSGLRLRWDGGERLTLKEDGSLSLKHALGELRDPAPKAWQVINGGEVPVDCAFCLLGENEFGFVLSGEYKPTLPLVVDPLIPYSTYLGGSGLDAGYAIAVDSQGYAYVTGYTTSTHFPVTPGAFQPTPNDFQNAFVTKLSQDGKSLIYSTFLGGSNWNSGYAIAADNQGYAYMTGITASTDFPVTPGGFQMLPGGNTDAFVTKLAPDGAGLIYSTYLGGTQNDVGLSIAVDDQYFAYVTGYTYSANFPVTPGAFQPTQPGADSAFVTKLSASGTSLVYSTYLGGTSGDEGRGIAVDDQYFAYVTGYTASTNFPVTSGAFQAALQGNTDAFVTKLFADGTGLVYSTYLGDSGTDIGNAIAVDDQYRAHVTGSTDSFNFPVTPGVFQPTRNGPSDAFITKLEKDGGGLVCSTYLGGSTGNNSGRGIALDSQGRVYVTGQTSSNHFPITPALIPSSFGGIMDAFVGVLSADLSSLLISFYLGGTGWDVGTGIALGPGGAVYTTGQTESGNFPVTPDAFQTTLNGTGDAYVSMHIFKFVTIRNVSLSVVKIG